MLAICVLGIGLRLRFYLQARPLWLDPAMLALNILDKGPRELFGPLDWNQAAPVGFLRLEKAAVAAFGDSELALGAVPFACAVAALLLFALVAWQAFHPAVAAVLVLPFAVSATAIFYGAEVKQYSADLLAVAFLLWATAETVRRRADATSVGIFLLIGTFTTWISHASGFALAAGLVATWWALPRRSSSERRRFTLMAFVSLVHWAAMAWFLTRRTLPGGALDYHARSFPPVTDPVELISWCSALATGFFRAPLHAGVALAPLLLLVLVGLLPEWSSRAPGSSLPEPDPVQLALRRAAWISLSAALLASAFRLYPLAAGGGAVASRLVLFMAPLVLVLLGVGLTRVAGRSRVFAVALGLWIVAGVGLAAFAPAKVIHEDMRSLAENLSEHRSPGDRVFVYYFSLPAFDYYNREYRIPHARGTIDRDIEADLRQFFQEDPAVERLWVVLSHDYVGASESASRYLAPDFRRARTRSWSGARLTLWQRRHPPSAGAPDQAPDPETREVKRTAARRRTGFDFGANGA